MDQYVPDVATQRKEVIYTILRQAETAEPLRASPPEAVDYVSDLMTRPDGFEPPNLLRPTHAAAKNDFGYSPSVSLDDGLARLAAWHRAQHG